MTRRAYFYFGLTFLLGILVGAGGEFYYAWHSGRWHPPFSEKHAIERMQRDLNLSPAQVQQLTQIMNDEVAKFRALREQTDPQFEALRKETGDRIRQILTPDQLAKFNEIVRRHRAEARRRRPPPPPSH